MLAISLTLLVAFTVSLLMGAVFASHQPGDEPDGDPVTELLYSIDRRVPNKAEGSAVLHLGPRRRDLSRLEVNVDIRSLPTDVSRVYRLWVVNDFVGDGVLIKTFRAKKNGSANFRTHRHIRDISEYRRLVVTIESRHLRRQSGSSTHGPTIMEGMQPLEGD